MHIACLFRGPRKWVLASIFILSITYHILVKSQPEAIRNIRLSFPVTFDDGTGQAAADVKDTAPKQRVLQDYYPPIEEDFRKDGAIPDTSNLGAPTFATTPDVASTTLRTVSTRTTPSDLESSTTSTAPTLASPSLVASAHTLPSNDAFLPHFSALPSVKNLSVADAMSTCKYTAKEESHFQHNIDAPWKINLTPDLFIALKREEWQSFIQHDLIPWSSVSSHFSGRGIIVVAGHPKSIKRLKVTLRSLLDLGSTLPVEVHFYGDELDLATQQDLRSLYDHPTTKGTRLFFNDLAGVDQIQKSSYNKKVHVNYQLKTAALINSRFLEPLLLDSDNIPAIDPEGLWNSKAYQEYGAVFWPDFSRTRPEHPAWAITNTYCRRDEYEFESGQVIVDKRRVFYHLQLAAWWNEQSFWNDILLGDKDTFRFAWHALQTKFGTPKKWITSVGFLAEQDVEGGFPGETRLGYCGHTFAQHHPDFEEGKPTGSSTKSGIAFFHGGTLKSISAPLMTRLRENKGGIFTHYKRSKLDEDWWGIEYDVGLRYWHSGFYYKFTPEPVLTGKEDFDKDGKPISQGTIDELQLTDEDRDSRVLCTDWGEVKAKPLSVIGEEGFEERFENAGGYWAIEDVYRWGKSGA